jgi:AraC family transcriptional activator of pobA
MARSSTGRRRTEEVPRYGLYGEHHDAVDVEFLHIEDVRTRSEQLGWEIRSHTHVGLNQLVLLCDGGVSLRFDETTASVTAPALLTVPSGTVHSFRFVPATHGYVLTIASTWLDASPLDVTMRRALFHAPRCVTIADHHSLVRLERLVDQLLDEFVSGEPGRSSMLHWLAQTTLVMAARAVPREPSTDAHPEDVELVTALREVIETTVLEHLTTRAYATALHVSPSTLNRACLAVAGCTAFELSQRRLELEARRRLVYIGAPVAQIAGELGFDDAAYFARFFRRRTGCSPRRFREERRAELSMV